MPLAAVPTLEIKYDTEFVAKVMQHFRMAPFALVQTGDDVFSHSLGRAHVTILDLANDRFGIRTVWPERDLIYYDLDGCILTKPLQFSYRKLRDLWWEPECDGSGDLPPEVIARCEVLSNYLKYLTLKRALS